MEFLIQFGIYFGGTVLLLMLGVLAGGWAERKHFRSLDEREANTQSLIVTQSKLFIEPMKGHQPPLMVCAETVVASDYFKNFLSAFRKFFGGEMKSYNSLMDRARRETLMRLKEQAIAMGYDSLCNVRLEPADVGGMTGKKAAVMVCILGSATAYHSGLSKFKHTAT